MTLRKPAPIRDTTPLGGWQSCLPPVRRSRQAVHVELQDMPSVFTFALVDEIAEQVRLSKGKARKLIAKGKVWVNGAVVYDPDMRVDAAMKVEVFL